ncbi:serpin family protein [Salmonella enterica]|nr:serpin family protein [Salmonella enterica]
MSPLLVLGLLVAGFCPAALCDTKGTQHREPLAQEDQDNGTEAHSLRLVSSNTDFAFSLYQQLARKAPGKNIIFSPLSISCALAFLSLGARGTTRSEIIQGLKFNLTQTPEEDIHRGFGHLLRTLGQPGQQLQLSTGSALFVQEQLQLLDAFKEAATARYLAQAFTTDFRAPEAAKELINDYVSKQTEGKIQDLISDLKRGTMMVLVNYILFKGKWKEPFDPRDTYESKFYVSKRRSVKVPMMSLQDLTIPYFRDEELSCSVLALEYKDNASALFVLPDQGRMQEVEASLRPDTLRRWRDSLKPSRIDELYMPKFSISGDYSLETILPQLGIREVFSTQADLSGITGSRKLKVSQVVHKAVLDVAETGTEAAAATGVKFVLTSAMLDPVIVSFDRPFLMAIVHENTQTLLFLGKVVNPKQA